MGPGGLRAKLKNLDIENKKSSDLFVIDKRVESNQDLSLMIKIQKETLHKSITVPNKRGKKPLRSVN